MHDKYGINLRTCQILCTRKKSQTFLSIPVLLRDPVLNCTTGGSHNDNIYCFKTIGIIIFLGEGVNNGRFYGDVIL